MSVELNKISLKQMGGEAQQQVDPQVMEISQAIASSVQEGQNPQEVVAALVQNQVDQQVIAQALMMVGMAEEDILALFEQIERSTQPSTPEEVNSNPELLARNEDIIQQEEQVAQQDPMMGMAKSGIEIKPENRGKFTAWAKKRGMTVSEAANKVMSNKDRYTPDVVKMANFAKNAAAWDKAQEGGSIKDEEKSFLGKIKDNFLYNINPLYTADDTLQAMGIPANFIREGIEGIFDKGDGEFNSGDIVPDIKGTTILDDDKKQTPVSQTLGIDNWAGALATDMVLDPTTFIGAGVIKNLIKKAGKTAVKKLPKLATLFEDGGQPKGQFVNGVFIPDESEIANDAFNTNIQRPDEFYFPDSQNAVLPMMPPPTVNPLFDIINTVGTVVGDVRGELSNFGDKVDQYKADKYKYYDVDLDYSDVRSDENTKKFMDFYNAGQKELEYRTQENKAKADKQTSELVQNKPTFEQWLQENPGVTNMDTARSMFDSIYNKMFGGPVLKAQFGVGTPGFNPDADGDGIPDVMDIDGGEGTGVPAYGTVDRPNLEDMYNDINFTPEVNVNNPVSGTIDRLGDNPYIRAGASILGATSDLAGLYNRIADQKTYLEAEDQKEERSGADYKYATKMSGPRSRGTYDALSGQLGSEADRVAGYYMNFAGSPYSYSGVAKTGGEFKPHMMFDPKTGEGYKANVPGDHERMAKMGYLHKDEMQDGGEVVELSQDMIAQLIAAGADIEIL